MADETAPGDAGGLTPAAVDPSRVEQTVRWLLSGARDADVVEAIRTNALYVITHRETQAFLERRFERLRQAIGAAR